MNEFALKFCVSNETSNLAEDLGDLVAWRKEQSTVIEVLRNAPILLWPI